MIRPIALAIFVGALALAGMFALGNNPVDSVPSPVVTEDIKVPEIAPQRALQDRCAALEAQGFWCPDDGEGE
jgi:hypothetical protein